MKPRFHYATVTNAISELIKLGFTTDFNLKENNTETDSDQFVTHKFEIADVYRYEGNSDPADEANVYAIVSDSGVKGILVTGYGIDVGNDTTQLLTRLHY